VGDSVRFQRKQSAPARPSVIRSEHRALLGISPAGTSRFFASFAFIGETKRSNAASSRRSSHIRGFRPEGFLRTMVS
jgi:hypothetical protein